MKKSFLLVLALCAMSAVWGTTVTKTITQLKDANSWVTGKYYAQFALDDIISVNANDGTNNGKFYENTDRWRLFSTADGFRPFVISAKDGYCIASITLTFGSNAGGTLYDNQKNVATKNQLTSGSAYDCGGAQSVTLYSGYTGTWADNTRTDIYQFEVTYFPAATNIALQTTLELTVGDQVQPATITPADAYQAWTTSDESKVTVSQTGVVEALAVTTEPVTITVKSGNIEKSCAVTVKTSGLPTPTLTFADGNAVTKDMNANGYINALTNTGDGAVSYESSDLTVATVAADGAVTIIGVGTTIITAATKKTASYMAAEARYTLTITDPEEAAIFETFIRNNGGASTNDRAGAYYTWKITTGARTRETDVLFNQTPSIWLSGNGGASMESTTTIEGGIKRVSFLWNKFSKDPTSISLNVQAGEVTRSLTKAVTGGVNQNDPDLVFNSNFGVKQNAKLKIANPQNTTALQIGPIRITPYLLFTTKENTVSAAEGTYDIKPNLINNTEGAVTYSIVSPETPSASISDEGIVSMAATSEDLTIQASWEGVTTQMVLHVISSLFPNVSFEHPYEITTVGADYALQTLTTASDGVQSFFSSDETIAKVEGTTLTTFKAGVVTITGKVAQSETYLAGEATYQLTVRPAETQVITETYKGIDGSSGASSECTSVTTYTGNADVVWTYRYSCSRSSDKLASGERALWLHHRTSGNSYFEAKEWEGGIKSVYFDWQQADAVNDGDILKLQVKVDGTEQKVFQANGSETLRQRDIPCALTLELKKSPAKITFANISSDKEGTNVESMIDLGPITIVPYLQYTKKNVLVKEGDTYTNTNIIDNRDNENPIVYSSSDASIASVDASGLVSAKKTGNVVITATWDSISTSYSLKVSSTIAGPHRLGTYNIRTSSSTSDTGDKAWSVRRDAVINMIRDTMDFDVLTLDEVSETQWNYLNSQLGSIYTFLKSSRHGNSILAFRTERYLLLDNGYFFLSSTGKDGPSWDDSNHRAFVWAKLQDRFSDEIFYFGATHIGLEPKSIRNGSKMATDSMRIIAGDYPSFIAGDMNFEVMDHEPNANFKEYYGNAREMSKTEPKGCYNTFSSGMAPGNGSKLLDFLFVRNAEVESYFVSNSSGMPGRTLLPSDHMPLVCEITMLPANRSHIHRVTNVEELRQAAALVQATDTIVLAGSFDLGTEPLTITSTCTLIGEDGCEITASTNVFAPNPMISLNIENITIKNVEITDEGWVGGIVFGEGNYLNIKNCSFINNTTAGVGWIHNEKCPLTVDHCIFIGNKTLAEAGCIYTSGECDLSVINNNVTVTHCLFMDNEANSGPAMYLAGNGKIYVYGCSFIRNIAQNQGAVTMVATTNGQDNRFVNNTFVANRIDRSSSFRNATVGGSAFYLQTNNDRGKIVLVNNTVVGNYTACRKPDGTCADKFVGGAIYALAGRLYSYNNIVAGNISSCVGRGDISMVDPDYLMESERNIYSCSTNMNINASKSDILAPDEESANNELKILFPHLMRFGQDSIVIGLSPQQTTFAGQSIQVLDEDARSAAKLNSDILNIGKYSGILTVDQTGATRADLSVPGAIEYGTQGTPIPYTDIDNTSAPMHRSKVMKYIENGRIVIRVNNHTYTILGRKE